MRSKLSFVSLACLGTLLAACSSTPKVNESAASNTAAVTRAAPTSPTPTGPVSAPAPTKSVATKALPAHLDPSSELFTQRSVFFDFDRATFKPEYTPLIERHGRYLLANPDLAIRVEGNTDERGGTEYNLALGQRRAQSVAKALSLLGVKEKQMEVVSWGKERPKSSGHDEASWAQNRRVDLQYPAK